MNVMRPARSIFLAAALTVAFIALGLLAPAPITDAQTQSASVAASSIIIALPQRLVAGQPATLAVFGADGKLAPNVDVDINGSQRVRTNSTGRVSFIAPASGNAVIARAEGASAAALLDSAPPKSAPGALSIAPILSLRDRFSICGGSFRGDANENHVKVNVEVSLILAASPECLVILEPDNMPPGPAIITIDSSSNQMTASTTLVSLEFGPPKPPLLPGKSGVMAVWVQGSDRRLHVVVTNESPGVLTLVRGNSQQLVTSGGPQNFVKFSATALSSGGFSLHARLLAAPDAITAGRFLECAAPLAEKQERTAIVSLANRLAHHPRDAEKVRAQIAALISRSNEGDVRILLDAASHALE